MQEHNWGEAIILNQDDVDEINSAIMNLSELVWETLERRRILLRPPCRDLQAMIISRQTPDTPDSSKAC